MVRVNFEGSVSEVLNEMREFTTGGPQLTITSTVPKTPKKEKAAESAAPATETKPAESAAVTFQDVKEIIPKLMEKLGKPDLITFLAGFDGAKKGSEIKESRYAEFIDKAKKALA
jgi:hypothetical protein